MRQMQNTYGQKADKQTHDTLHRRRIVRRNCGSSCYVLLHSGRGINVYGCLHKCEPPHLLPLMILIPSGVWYHCVLKGGSVKEEKTVQKYFQKAVRFWTAFLMEIS